MRRKGTNAVRIIGGAWRSRLVRFPDAADLRPTPDRVRETLFNWLGQDLSGKRCLDLFAGSGALGFEALSRGAAGVVMVETSRAAHSALRESATRLGAGDRLKLVHGDALHFIATSGQGGYDVVFVDPPYGSELAGEALARLPGLLARGGVVYIESESPLALGPPWRARRHGRAGAVHYQLIEWGGHDDGSLSGHI